MNKKDMDFIVKFAAASSAALILSGCSTEGWCVYGPPPDAHASSEKQNSATTTLMEEPTSEESTNTQDLSASMPKVKRVSRGACSVVYGPPPK